MKLVISKSKNSEHLYISKSFRKDGKVSTRTVVKLGSMSELLPLHHHSRDEVIAWAKDQARLYTEKEKNDTLDVILKLSSSKRIDLEAPSLFNVGYLFIQDIFYNLKLDHLCKDIASRHHFQFDLTDILSKLIYSRILSPSSKRSSFEYSQSLIESPNFDIHQVYRALSILSKESDFIQSSLYKNSLNVVERNTSVLYYDCSNFFFEIEEADGLKQYGKSKENRPNPIVQMGLFLDGHGIPLSFVIFSGNQSEQPSLIPLEKKIIKDFKLSKFIVCTDAGLASAKNREFNNKNHRSYIVTQSLKKLKKHLKDWALDPEGWSLTKSNQKYNIHQIDEVTNYHQVYYKERWINENGLSQRLIVSFSPKYKNYQQSVREGQIKRAQKAIDDNKTIKTRNPNSSSRFVKELKTTSTGEVAKEIYYELNTEAIAEEMKYDGFYGVCTTLEDDIETIIEINKRRWEIEESFRIMKSDLKTRPIYVQREDRIKAHFLICFISLMIYRILEKKVKEKYTVEELMSTLRGMNMQHHNGYGYIPVYKRTKITDELHEIFGIQTDTEIVSEKNMKKIIKKTKS